MTATGAGPAGTTAVTLSRPGSHEPWLAGRCCRGRLRLFCAAAQLIATASERRLRCARHWPWTEEITDTISRLGTFPEPG